MKPRTN